MRERVATEATEHGTSGHQARVLRAPAPPARSERMQYACAPMADSEAPRSAGTRLVDLLLTRDPLQRLRLSQAGLAMLLLALGVAAMHYFVWMGAAAARPVAWWSGVALGGMALFFAVIRSGWSRQWLDPALTVPQMVFAIGCGAAAYALVGVGRGGVFPIVMVILMFGMFHATPRQMRWVSVYAVLLFGTVMAVMTMVDPRTYPLAVEIGHFLMVATMMPAVSVLAARLADMRRRNRAQRAELTQALARIRELATRDELTGLINRRHMHELLAQEHQRCIRSGQTFCLAVVDLDRFKAINDRHGRAIGDVLLNAMAQELQRQVRVADLVSRWDGDRFVLMLPDTRAVLARGGLDRLQQKLGALRLIVGEDALQVTVSAGLAEHIAGERVADTLTRAERALEEAKTTGRTRLVVAGECTGA
jgi:diguanylate cyclase